MTIQPARICWRCVLAVLALCAVGAVIGWLVAMRSARAHDGYTGLRNPVTHEDCCHSKDCRPVDAREIGEAGDLYTWQGATLPKRQSMPSPDERYHVCAFRLQYLGGQGQWKIRCLLRPAPGS